MTLSRCIEEYVRHRRSLGVQFHGEQVQLSAFVKVVGDIALTEVDAEAIRRYIDGKGPVTRAWFSRFHTVAGFYRFATARQYTTRAPLPPRPPKPPAEFIPYIYSETDVRALLTAVDARHEEDWLVLPQTARTLLLFLYATGLRISEALALTMADVDLREAILTIRETKFYKSRLVPIGADLLDVPRPLSRPSDCEVSPGRRAVSVRSPRAAPLASDRGVGVQTRARASRTRAPSLPDVSPAAARLSAHVRDESIGQLVPRGQERAAAPATSFHVPWPLQREGNAAVPLHDVRVDDGGGPSVLEVRHSWRAT